MVIKDFLSPQLPDVLPLAAGNPVAPLLRHLGGSYLGGGSDAGKPKAFDGNYEHAPEVPAEAGPVDYPPVVPGPRGATGSGVHVNTLSLAVFADYVDILNRAVDRAYNRLSLIRPVAPGAFKQANDIRTKVNNDGGGLKAGYLKVLDDLNKGLIELGDGIRALAARYRTVEGVNSITADKLNKAIEKADPPFGQLATDGAIK